MFISEIYLPWETEACTEVQMPVEAEVLSVSSDGSRLSLWVLLDPEKVWHSRTFEVFMAGKRLPTGTGVQRKFIGSAAIDGTMLHVFERLD